MRHRQRLTAASTISRCCDCPVATSILPLPARSDSLLLAERMEVLHLHQFAICDLRFRLMNAAKQESIGAPQHHRAARVINGWLNDEDYSQNGIAKTLEIGTEFKALVSKYSGDITPRPILDELLRVGAVEKPTPNTLRLLVPAYIPHNSDEDLIQIFGDSVADLLSTMAYNLNSEPDTRRLQISVVYNNLPDEVLSNIELVSRDQSLEFLQHLNQFFETQDRDSNPNVKGSGRNRAGIGLYFFQEKMDEN